MKKNIIIKRVFFISLMLLNIVFITIYNRKLYASTLENNFILHSSIDRPEGISSAHYFTNGIADGGIYYIINKRTGKYLDVQNAETADGTKLWTYEGNQSNAQKFKINYLGQETYELVPQVSSKVVQISNENEDCNTIISKKNKGDKKQEFRIKAINSNTYRIYSNENNYVLAVSHTKIFGGFYKDNSYVVSKNYIFLENSAKDFAEWEIVSTGELEHSIYTRYYIKNVNTGLFLEVQDNGIENNTLVYATGFTSLENQQWNRYYDTQTNKFILKAGHRTDMVLDSYNNQLAIYNDNFPQDQRYDFQYVGTNQMNGNGQYYIKTSTSFYERYLSIGNYDENTSKYKVISSPVSDLWELIMVPHKGSKKSLIHQNITHSQIVESYGDEHILTFIPNESGIYEFNLNYLNSSNIIIEVYDLNMTNVSLGKTYAKENGQKNICYLEEGKIYYAYIYNLLQHSEKAYTIKVSLSTIIYLHGMNTYLSDNRNNPPDDRRLYCTEQIEDYLISKNGYAPILNSPSNMTSNFVMQIDPLTNIIPLTAPMYVFRGHGSATSVAYHTGTSYEVGKTTYLRNYNISNLNLYGGGFVAWIGCSTAGETTSNYGNMPKVTVNAGAEVSLGFKESIYTNDANTYGIELVKYIVDGYSIREAVQQVSSKYAEITGLKSFIIEGNGDYKLKPNQVKRNFIQKNIPKNLLNTILEDGYILESIDSNQTQRYTKMINGMLTGDYYELYYDDGLLVDYYKSPINISESEKCIINNIYSFPKYNAKMIFDNPQKYDKIISDKVFDYLIKIDDTWTPVRFYQIVYKNDIGYQQMDLYGINMINGEYVSTNYLYFKGE